MGERRRMGWEGRKRSGGWEGGGRGREGRGCGGARKVVCPGARPGSRRAYGDISIPSKLCLLVPFLRYSASKNGVTLKPGVRVVQGH